jgi:hypothetical protein
MSEPTNETHGSGLAIPQRRSIASSSSSVRPSRSTTWVILGLILARLLGHSLWAGLLILLGTWTVCVVVLHLVFRQPLERLLQYRELHDD